jgi:hypothetical protein
MQSKHVLEKTKKVATNILDKMGTLLANIIFQNLNAAAQAAPAATRKS